MFLLKPTEVVPILILFLHPCSKTSNIFSVSLCRNVIELCVPLIAKVWSITLVVRYGTLWHAVDRQAFTDNFTLLRRFYKIYMEGNQKEFL